MYIYTYYHANLTRSEEVETIWAELQRLSGEYRRHSQSVKTSLEVAEERVTANREQVMNGMQSTHTT